MNVITGKEISVEYTLRLDDQTVIESTVGSDPLTYKHGMQEIIPGLEKALDGMTVGETKQVTVNPAEGYGTVNPQAIVEVKKETIPPDAQKVGAQLQGKDPEGRPIFPHVTEVKTDTVVLDFNHPLAGKTLHFDVKVTGVK